MEDEINELLTDVIEEIRQNVGRIDEILPLPKLDFTTPTKGQMREFQEYARQSGEFPNLQKLLETSPQRTKLLFKMLPILRRVLVPDFKGTIKDLQLRMGLVYYGSPLYDQIREFLSLLVELGMLNKELNERGAYVFSTNCKAGHHYRVDLENHGISKINEERNDF